VPESSLDDPKRIGRILVEDGLLTEEQLSKALRIQSRLEASKPWPP